MPADPAVLQELQQWKAAKDALMATYRHNPNAATPDEVAVMNGDTLSPEARRYQVGRVDPATGKPANGVNGEHFDEKTGEIRDNKGLWDLPETYAILASAASPFAAPLIAGALGGSAAGGGAASTAATTAGAGGGILGTAGKLAGLAGTIGQTASALTQGRAAGRLDQTNVDQAKDRLAQARYQSEMDAARLNLAAPGQRANTSVKGDILANAQPFRFTGGTQMVGNIPVPQSTGGLNPGIFSANTRALGGQLSSQALKDNTAMGGKAIGAPPPITDTPQPGVTDSILNTAGIVGGLTQGFGDYLKKYKQPRAANPDDPNLYPPKEEF